MCSNLKSSVSLQEIKQSYWNKSNALEPGFTNGKLPETNYANGFFAQVRITVIVVYGDAETKIRNFY